MNGKLILYHGSSQIVEAPVYGAGRKNNDYGRGFYCTEHEDLAREWACTPLTGGYANRYSIDMSGLRMLDLNGGDYTILHWIAVLTAHRLFRTDTPVAGRGRKYLQEHFSVNVEAYDVIRGYRADDAYYDFADVFLNNAITVEQLARAMRLGGLGEQIVLKSPLAFTRLIYEGYSEASSEIYYPNRKARADAAENAFHRITEEDVEGMYLIDIIRKGVECDDPRIPGNVSGQGDGPLGRHV